MNTQPSTGRWRAEAILVALVTLVGGIIRCWNLHELGLTHFDEGIYALAGSWIFGPKSLAGLDPSLIPYAPPGYPILVGLSYFFLGISDTSAILVSIVAGTLTIPVVAWLARRTFGLGAGVGASVLVALSGPHIAFSRMALTDASFLLAWLVAIVIGQRFLEKPNCLRAIAMGLAVGLAQEFKYNGWLVGAIVIVTAVLDLSRKQEAGQVRRTFGWGLIGALVAALVVLPWFLFVEDHGGYSGLIRHQQSYLVGWGRWLSSLRTQASQAVGLSGEWPWLHVSLGVAAIGAGLMRWPTGPDDKASWSDLGYWLLLLATGMGLVGVVPNAVWWFGLALIPGLLLARTSTTRVVGSWWLILSVMTPLYHPYARLWLPIHAVGWVIVGGAMSNGIVAAQPYLRRIRGLGQPGDPSARRFAIAWGWALGVAVICSIDLESIARRSKPLRGLLEPTDSVRLASDRIILALPKDVQALRVYGRPCLTFYLGGRIPIQPQPDIESLTRPGDSRTWILMDCTVWSPNIQPPGVERWATSISVQTQAGLPTLLDIDPDSSTFTKNRWTASGFPLILSRPLRPGELK